MPPARCLFNPRAQDAGFDHHLVKPIALDALMPLLTSDD